MTRKEALQYIHQALKEAGFEDPQREARYLIEATLKLPSGQIFLQGDVEIQTHDYEILKSALERRLRHEPLSRIIGVREFWGMPFQITPDTLDPRADSETLIEAVLGSYRNKQSPLKILDLGTGSGCLLISLLKEFPCALGVGVDLAWGAAKTAMQNAQALGVAERALFFQGRWCDALWGLFDIIISNPPYIPKDHKLERNVIDYDPHLALFAADNGLRCYQELASCVGHSLAASGRVFFEIGQGQYDAVTSIMADEGFTLEGVHKDLAGIERVLAFGLEREVMHTK